MTPLPLGQIIKGDCRDVMRTWPAGSVSLVLMDGPYDLGFMGQGWDTFAEFQTFMHSVYVECFRVLKPGGYVLAFGAPRREHRNVCAAEDAGFEIRDKLIWLFGEGMPKSHNVSKAIDRHLGAEREQVPPDSKGGAAFHRPWMDDPDHKRDGPKAATPQAEKWDGWGTALKPGWEPIMVARKPFAGSVAENVLEHGTGGLNIEACRLAGEGGTAGAGAGAGARVLGDGLNGARGETVEGLGRWPANVVMDSEAAVMLDAQAGPAGGFAPPGHSPAPVTKNAYGEVAERSQVYHGDTGGPSRFFYCAKARSGERGSFNDHPTVKPVSLMRWLARLGCPPGGVVLDPFGGSGSTAVACELEGFDWVLIEQHDKYVEIARRRVAAARAGEMEPGAHELTPGERRAMADRAARQRAAEQAKAAGQTSLLEGDHV